MLELKRVCKMRHCQTIVNLNKLDRISHFIQMCWVWYVCWDVQAGSNELDGTFTVSLHCTMGQGPILFFFSI